MLSLMKRKVFCVLTLLIATPNSLNAANQTSPEELFTKCYESQNSQQPDKEPCEYALQFATLKNNKALLLSHLAILQFKTGQKPDALITISEAVTIAPKNPAVIINLGHLRIRQGLFLEALEAFDLASRLGAIQEPAVYLNRSIALRGLGRYPEARENYVQYRLLIDQTDQREP